MTWPEGIAAAAGVIAVVLLITDQHRTRVTGTTRPEPKPPDGEQP